MAELFERNAGRFGYELTRIAEQDDQPVGMLVSCAGSELNRLNIRSVPHFFAVMGLVDALAFIVRGVRLPGGIEAEPDEYYLSNIGVLPAAQGQGIGSYLLGHAENLARARSLFKCALLVGLGNTQAFCLYQRMGYRVVETVHDENESLAYHRMVKRLN
jgi:ribosomal protein S18 acetylase RimI-like enzyme